MPITTSQYNALLSRMRSIEEHINNLNIASDRFATLQQLSELVVLWQTDLDDISTRMAAIEARMDTLESEPLT
jgi:hypothetical protein